MCWVPKEVSEIGLLFINYNNHKRVIVFEFHIQIYPILIQISFFINYKVFCELICVFGRNRYTYI